MRVDFEIIDTVKEKIICSRKAFIEFYPEYLKWVVDYESEEINEDSGIPERKTLFNNRIMDRKSIIEICLYRIVNTGNWVIQCDNGNEPVSIHYKEYPDAKKLFNEIVNWRYK